MILRDNLTIDVRFMNISTVLYSMLVSMQNINSTLGAISTDSDHFNKVSKSTQEFFRSRVTTTIFVDHDDRITNYDVI